MICKKCGTNNDGNTGKCTKCGAKLSASKEKESVFDISVSSVLVMIFSLVAVLVLLIPDTRTVSTMEIVTGAPSVQDDGAIELLEKIKEGQSIANEREKIDKNLAVLNDGGSSSAKMFIIDSWTPDEAIAVLEEAKNSPDVDVPARVSGIRERVAKVEAKQAEVNELSAEVPLAEEEDTTPPKEFETLKKASRELETMKQDLENYITESINALNPDDVDRGALGGVVREHRLIQPMIENVALVLAILTMAFFVLTIIAWATKFYRLRLITMIADIVLTLATFFVPLIIWSIEYKWPYEVSSSVTYGFNFGQTFILVLVCAIGVLAAGFAYFSDIFAARKSS